MTKLNLLLSLFVVSLFLTSCLKEGDGSFSHPGDFSYITQDDNGLVYARTFYEGRGNLITSSGIKNMEPGKFVITRYSWNNENGTVKTSDGNTVYNVITTEISEPLSTTTLNMSPATENGFSFKAIHRPIFDSGTYFDDHWAFSYVYSGKEGEAPVVSFFEAARESGQNSDEVIIDVRLNKIGPASGTQDKELTNSIVVDMSPLRQKYAAERTNTKVLNIKFRHYQEGKTEPVFSQYTYPMVLRDN